MINKPIISPQTGNFNLYTIVYTNTVIARSGATWQSPDMYRLLRRSFLTSRNDSIYMYNCLTVWATFGIIWTVQFNQEVGETSGFEVDRRTQV